MRPTKPLPSLDEMNALVRADLDAGKLFWRSNDAPVGSAGCVFGAPRVKIAGQVYYQHRVIFKIATGEEPAVIDHIDGNRANCSISNLRATTDAENMKNKARYGNNASGVANVQRDKGKWRVRFKVNGITRSFGAFSSLEAAEKHRDKVRADLGYHPNHGRVA